MGQTFLPRQRGFDYFYGYADTGIDYYTHERYGFPSHGGGSRHGLFRREAVRFIDENRARPFLLYFTPNAPHVASTYDKKAHQVPDEYLRMFGTKS